MYDFTWVVIQYKEFVNQIYKYILSEHLRSSITNLDRVAYIFILHCSYIERSSVHERVTVCTCNKTSKNGYTSCTVNQYMLVDGLNKEGVNVV